MIKDYSITFYLDTRRSKKNGKYPLKFNVYVYSTGEKRMYSTKYEFTEKEFFDTWETKKPQKQVQILRLELQSLENYLNELAEKINIFTLESFEEQLFHNKKYKENDVLSYYQRKIDYFKKNKQIGTALNYKQSINSLLLFHSKSKLYFHHITTQWLKNYENYMFDKGSSATTIGIYLRPLRAIFNSAVEEKIVHADLYPFGKGKYVIPAPKSTKKALSKDNLKKLFEGIPQTPEQQKAKDFWFFSYACNGMNIKDITHLQYKNIQKDILRFVREKTKKTSRNSLPVEVVLNSHSLAVIEKYGVKPRRDDAYIFPILNTSTSDEEKYRQTQNFIRFINQNFLKYARNLGIEEDISTYWARHSFATNAIRSGASFELISEMLSHTSLMTTKNYFAGFETEEKRKISDKLMEF